MTLLEYLVIGSYVWTTMLAAFMWRSLSAQLTRLETNHLAHLAKDVVTLKTDVAGLKAAGSSRSRRRR